MVRVIATERLLVSGWKVHFSPIVLVIGSEPWHSLIRIPPRHRSLSVLNINVLQYSFIS